MATVIVLLVLAWRWLWVGWFLRGVSTIFLRGASLRFPREAGRQMDAVLGQFQELAHNPVHLCSW